MNLLKRLFVADEIRAVVGVIDEAAYRFRRYDLAFEMTRAYAERIIEKDSGGVIQAIREGQDPRVVAYLMFCSYAGPTVTTGEYHVYRGALNPMGPGDGLVTIFEQSLDELVRLGAFRADKAAEQKRILHAQIAEVG